MNPLAKYYYDPKTGFQSSEKLYRRATKDGHKVSRTEVKQFLSNQESVQRTRQYRAPKRDQYQPITSGIDGAYQIDLTFMPHDKTINRNFDTMLTAIEITSRKLYAIPLRGKETATILRALLALFNAVSKPVQTVTCDLGSEFTSNVCKKLFEEKQIRVYYADKADHHKMGMIERVHRTLKGILTKYMTAHNTKCWVDQLGAAVSNYNSSYHTSIKQTPNEADQSSTSRDQIRQEATERSQRTTHDQLHEGDMVRSLIEKETFDKEKPRWSKQVYRITECNGTSYLISDGTSRRWKRYELMKVTKAERNPLPRPKGPHDMEAHLERARKQRGARPASPVEPNEPELRERPTAQPPKPPSKERETIDRSILRPGAFVFLKNQSLYLSPAGFRMASYENPMYYVARIDAITTKRSAMLTWYREMAERRYVAQPADEPWREQLSAMELMRPQPSAAADGSIELDALTGAMLHGKPVQLVGRTIRVDDGANSNETHIGRVTSQRRQSGKTIYRVTYQDGDTQTFTIQELYPYLDEEAHED